MWYVLKPLVNLPENHSGKQGVPCFPPGPLRMPVDLGPSGPRLRIPRISFDPCLSSFDTPHLLPHLVLHLFSMVLPNRTFSKPWGKHSAAKYKWNKTNFNNHESKQHVLPVVLVRDPFRWMQSMVCGYILAPSMYISFCGVLHNPVWDSLYWYSARPDMMYTGDALLDVAQIWFLVGKIRKTTSLAG
jgi:hypothetical protein